MLVGSAIVVRRCRRSSRATSTRCKSAVVSVTTFHAGEAYNVIAETGELRGTVRTLDPEVRDLIEARIATIVAGDRRGLRRRRPASTTRRSYPGHPQPPGGDRLRRRRRRARSSAPPASTRAAPPMMGGEDFSYMLEARPGAFIFIGNGDSAGLHHPAYDFNDERHPDRLLVLGAARRDGDARR